MKMIKSALLGNKQIAEVGEDGLKDQLREILKEHRAIIISKLVREIGTYTDYKFNVRPDKDLLIKIQERLVSLKNSPINLNNYQNVTQHLLNRPVVHLTNQPFYEELDKEVLEVINASGVKGKGYESIPS
jgi:hypothetical protein